MSKASSASDPAHPLALALSLERVRDAFHRLFLAVPGATLRREDEQKCLELVGVLERLRKVQRGSHLVDAAAGKASVGLMAAELLPIGELTILERDPARIAAAEAAARRLGRTLPVRIVHGDVAAASGWPAAPDAVVALHACGPAADLVLDGAIRSRARQIFLAPCCYGKTVRFRDRADRVIAELGFVEDDLLRRRMTASLVDVERRLRLEAAGFETTLEEFVAPTVSPHNLLFSARQTSSEVRIARARARLALLETEARPPDEAPV